MEEDRRGMAGDRGKPEGNAAAQRHASKKRGHALVESSKQSPRPSDRHHLTHASPAGCLSTSKHGYIRPAMHLEVLGPKHSDTWPFETIMEAHDRLMPPARLHCQRSPHAASKRHLKQPLHAQTSLGCLRARPDCLCPSKIGCL